MNNYPTNEWDQLKKVIVGTATGARIPSIDCSMRHVNYADVSDISTIPVGKYPEVVIDEANQDLDELSSTLIQMGIEVVRPGTEHPVEYYDYCPRDLVLAHGNHCIAAPMPIKSRRNNYRNIEHLTPGLIVSPTYNNQDLFNPACLGNPDVLALREHAPAFDAANILRADDDLLYLVSNSGNKNGARTLQEQTGLRVHTLENVYSYMHIDSTIAFLREGLMLVNPSRIKSIKQLPKPFCNWDYILCPEPVDIGYYGNYHNASPWINMNLLSVSPNLVILEQHQVELEKQLAKYNIESIMLPMRHQRTLGGGFHCVTLDLLRCGK